ncbi:MAG TPA: hypothetical protein VK132_06395 [Gemmatimonadales bacterium]|nr:hypothetical protein [Gemmatimonadales bacterium]
MTDLARFMPTVQVVPETESQPLQPLKMESSPGETSSVTTVPET